MHPAITHELARAIVADRERESRDATRAALVADVRARPAGRPITARRRTPFRRLDALVARRRAPDGSAASAR